MQLMSTSFKRVDGKYVWIGHNVLAVKVIENGESQSLVVSFPFFATSPPSPLLCAPFSRFLLEHFSRVPWAP